MLIQLKQIAQQVQNQFVKKLKFQIAMRKCVQKLGRLMKIVQSLRWDIRNF